MIDTTPKNNPSLYFDCHVFACTNERPDNHARGSCAKRGSVKLRNYMKARAKELKIPGVRINSAGCLDRCELGPVIVLYPEGIWYQAKSVEDIDAILQEHLINGNRVERLILQPEQTGLEPELASLKND